MSEEISISVIDKNTDNNDIIMSFSAPSYPSYKIGEVLYLESDIAPNVPTHIAENNAPLRFTKYCICDIHHSVKQIFLKHYPSAVNPFDFKIVNNLSMNVYVVECPDE